MRVVDTSAWIEWLAGSGISDRIQQELPALEDWIVPTIVQLELAKWLDREVPLEQARQVLALSQECYVVPLTTILAVRAAAASRRFGLSTADAVIYATALDEGADLLTCDAHFKSLGGVIYIPKTGN